MILQIPDDMADQVAYALSELASRRYEQAIERQSSRKILEDEAESILCLSMNIRKQIAARKAVLET